MFFDTLIRRGLVPAAAVIAEAKLTQPKEGQNQENACRASELPVYTPDPPVTKAQQEIVQQDPVSNFIESNIKSVRETLGKYTEEIYAYEKVAKQSLTESKENIEWLVDYLRQEDNTLPKAGAIGIGALTGLIFGLRGGFFKRTLYSTTGALGMAAVCYPKEASEYTREGIVEGKRLLTIAYNFAYGVKKDDTPLELPSLPKLPTSFSEAWDTVKTTASSFVSDDSSGAQKMEQVKNTSGVSIDPLEAAPLNLTANVHPALDPESLEPSPNPKK